MCVNGWMVIHPFTSPCMIMTQLFNPMRGNEIQTVLFSNFLSLSLTISLSLPLSHAQPPWAGGGAILGSTPHPTTLTLSLFPNQALNSLINSSNFLSSGELDSSNGANHDNVVPLNKVPTNTTRDESVG